MPVKQPDFLVSEHVFHAGTASQFADFMKRHRQDVIRIDHAPDRVVVTIQIAINSEEMTFATAHYP